MRNTIAVVGVIYPDAVEYFDDYLKSLMYQSVQNFDIILINDGVEDLQSITRNYRGVNIYIHNQSGNIIENRFLLIDYVTKNNYDIVIFTDTDDSYPVNRIEACCSLINNGDKIIINDLNITSNKGEVQSCNYLSNRFDDNQIINSKNIERHNILGFTNTSVKCNVLKNLKLKRDVDVIAFDWYFWSYVLDSGFVARFTKNTSSNYRVHDSNTIGINKTINKAYIFNSLSAKILHYQALSMDSLYYKSLFLKYYKIQRKCGDEDKLKLYINHILNNRNEHPLWWEDIIDFDFI